MTSVAVLDTNVALDWLLFDDVRMTSLTTALRAGAVRWVATTRMRDELAHVLSRCLARARGVASETVLEGWDAQVEIVATPVAAPARRLHCTDPDDQMFIDLAQAVGARWLLSRDRALLRLARRARADGIDILVPERWAF